MILLTITLQWRASSGLLRCWDQALWVMGQVVLASLLPLLMHGPVLPSCFRIAIKCSLRQMTVDSNIIVQGARHRAHMRVQERDNSL